MMEFNEAQELAYLNAVTSRNRRAAGCPKKHRLRFPAATAFFWFSGTALMIILAHRSLIPGWLMHLTTELLTFRFAFALGKFLELKGECNHV